MAHTKHINICAEIERFSCSDIEWKGVHIRGCQSIGNWNAIYFRARARHFENGALDAYRMHCKHDHLFKISLIFLHPSAKMCILLMGWRYREYCIFGWQSAGELGPNTSKHTDTLQTGCSPSGLRLWARVIKQATVPTVCWDLQVTTPWEFQAHNFCSNHSILQSWWWKIHVDPGLINYIGSWWKFYLLKFIWSVGFYLCFFAFNCWS